MSSTEYVVNIIIDRFSRLVILLVDDIADHVTSYMAALVQASYEVRLARSGVDALHILQSCTPAGAVIDVRLPDMSGWKLCRRIRQRHTTTRMRTIVLARDLTDADARTAYTCQAWLAQPVAGVGLAAAVHRILQAPDDRPSSPGAAVLGATPCPHCNAPTRATIRIGAMQHWRCTACRYVWRTRLT